MRRRTDPSIVIGYVRVSTDRQDLGPEAQRAALERWCRERTVTLASVHEDRVSGASEGTDRPGLVAALAAVRERRAGVLLVAKRDRIGRDMIVVAAIERAAERLGATVAAVDVADVDGTAGLVLRRTLDLVSEVERRMIGERTKAALAAKRARGEPVSHPPLGARVRNGRLVAHAGERAALERARVLRDRWGRTWRAIAAALDAEHPRPRGRRWYPNSVRRALVRA